MLPEVKSIEPLLKQILYGCVEHVQATKAALYLSAAHDLNDKTYELATSYQFNDPARRTLRANDAVVDRMIVKRNAFFVNGLGSDPRFSEILFRQSTDRLLAMPIFSRGRLAGFIDLRDKAGRKLFDTPDVVAGQRIVDEVVALLGQKNLFGMASIALSEPATAPAAAPPLASQSSSTPERRQEMSPSATRAIETARQIMGRTQLSGAPARRTISEHDLELVTLLLPAAIALPHAQFAVLSTIGHLDDAQLIVSRSAFSNDANEALRVHLDAWRRRMRQALPAMKPRILTPFGDGNGPLAASGIGPLLSAPVHAGGVDGLVLTVAFESAPDGATQRALLRFLRELEDSLDAQLTKLGSRALKQRIAEKLIEPDLQRHSDLMEHARHVSVVAGRLAALMELPQSQVEVVRLAAMVHDAGLRLLDFDRLHRRPALTPVEMKAIAEHPIIGAAIVEPLLGTDVAQAVLRHHERVDGKGYPSRLAGAAIPIAARILAVCDAWSAMTSKSSYQPSIPRDEAMTQLRAGAGTQFDEIVVHRFLQSIDEIGA
jgi:hypothetical protein